MKEKFLFKKIHLKTRDDSFWSELYRLDELEAKKVAKKGCPNCGSKLHKSNYLRKPRGIEQEKYEIRFSFCCSKCRKRVTPKSVRFLGKKVYWFIVHAQSAGAIRQKTSSASKLKQIFGVSKRSLSRWIKFWKYEFLDTKTWQNLKGLFSPPICEKQLLFDIFDKFIEQKQDVFLGLINFLKFLSPLSLNIKYPLLNNKKTWC